MSWLGADSNSAARSTPQRKTESGQTWRSASRRDEAERWSDEDTSMQISFVSDVETRGADDTTSTDTDPRSTSTASSGTGGSGESGAASGAGGAGGGNGAVGASGANTKKRKAPEPSITDVLRELGFQGLAVECERSLLMRQQLEFDMLARREESEIRREMAEQRRQEFEITSA